MGNGCAPLTDECCNLSVNHQKNIDSSDDDSDNESVNTDDNTFITSSKSKYPIQIDNTTIQYIIKEFERSIFNKDFVNAMAIMEEYKNIDFANHYFQNGDTCLHYAVRLHNAKFVYYLLQQGFNPNIQNSLTRDTSLHIATQHKNIRMIVTLMKFKADITVRNLLDKTAYDIALKTDDDEILSLYEPEFQVFLHDIEPSRRDYRATKRATFGHNRGASKIMMNAFEFSHKMGLSNLFKKDQRKTITTKGNKLVIPNINLTMIKENVKSNTVDDQVKSDAFIFNDYDANDYNNDNDSQRGSISGGLTPLTREQEIELLKDDLFNIDSNELNLSLVQSVSKKQKIALKTIKSINNHCSPKKDKLILKDWLQKLRTNIYPKIYQKRYLFVLDDYLCWNDKKVNFDPKDKLDAKKKKEYNDCISLLMIKDVVKYESKKQNTWKFQIICHNIKTNHKRKKKNKDKIYLWKCYSKTQRDKWVINLKKYCDSLNKIINDLDKNIDDDLL